MYKSVEGILECIGYMWGILRHVNWGIVGRMGAYWGVLKNMGAYWEVLELMGAYWEYWEFIGSIRGV